MVEKGSLDPEAKHGAAGNRVGGRGQKKASCSEVNTYPARYISTCSFSTVSTPSMAAHVSPRCSTATPSGAGASSGRVTSPSGLADSPTYHGCVAATRWSAKIERKVLGFGRTGIPCRV